MHGLARSLAPICLSLALLAPVSVRANGTPVPATGAVLELEHAVELSLAPEGATLLVTRTLFNAGITHGQVELPVPLPCSVTLDRVAIEEQDEQGQLRWRATELLDSSEAAQRWSTWLEGPAQGMTTVLDADTALHLHRDDYGCQATIEIYPVPPMHTRRVAYRVFVPSRYVDGHHEIELPTFAGHGEVASMTVAPWRDAAFDVEIDGTALEQATVTLAGDQAHAVALRRRDAGLGHVRTADLDLAGLIARHQPAAAALAPDEVPGRLLSATFEAPRELATLPPVRRVVVLLDTSRSLAAWDRQQLQELGARYLELLGETMQVKVEIVLFDRQLRRVYHDFVPGAWAVEDLRVLEIDALGNGSELGAALRGARELLAEPSPIAGADWVLVLSDLYLRSSFPLVDELDAAARSGARMHVVRPTDDRTSFHPGRRDEAWSMIARETGGMLWYASPYELDAMARELIEPTRIWSLRLELALVGGEHREVALADWHAAGETSDWLDDAHAGPALERAAFVGDVWGQRRAWTEAPSDAHALRLAGAIATSDELGFSAAARTALAHHAQVVSPFTSAWALASFAGPVAAPNAGLGSGGFGGRSFSTRCGGARGSAHGPRLTTVTIEQLVWQALASCPNASSGTLTFETTDAEIVDVTSDDRCIRERVWELDLSPTTTRGRRRITVEHTGHTLDSLDDVALGYRDLTMPTPNITTNTASGMK